MDRSYEQLRRLETFEERFDYLKLRGTIGIETFGFDRWINQNFYRSREWRLVRDQVIVRDFGCDLGILGYEIHSGLLVHHMNPMSRNDVIHGEDWIIDPNFLITTSIQTHNAIHYGDENLLSRSLVVRKSGDTKLW
jgi:hypothetical protein